MTPDAYCADRAARSGSSFYYSFRLLPPERRVAINALYAFCREVDDVVDEVSDANVARAKLAWWRAEVAAIYAGTPQHPVAVALAPAVRRYGLQQADLQTVIDGMQMDLEKLRYVIAIASPARSGSCLPKSSATRTRRRAAMRVTSASPSS